MFIEASTKGTTMEFPETLGHYRLIRSISKGATGIVFLAESVKEKKQYALKVVFRKELGDDESGLIHFEHEIRIQKFMNHPNIVKIFEILYFPDYIVIVMDYCENGDLFNEIINQKIRSTSKLIKMMFQIIDAVAYMHKKNVVHRDLKPDNIFLDKDMNIKIGDFGCCEETNEILSSFYDTCGTLFYAAPEILLHDESDLKKSDIWSLGIVFFTMFTAKLPWTPGETEEIKRQILNWDNTQIEENNEIFKIIKLCLERNPVKRPTADQLFHLKAFEYERRRSQRSTSTYITNKIPSLKSDPPRICRPNPRVSMSHVNVAINSFNSISHNMKRVRKSSCAVPVAKYAVSDSYLTEIF